MPDTKIVCMFDVRVLNACDVWRRKERKRGSRAILYDILAAVKRVFELRTHAHGDM